MSNVFIDLKKKKFISGDRLKWVDKVKYSIIFKMYRRICVLMNICSFNSVKCTKTILSLNLPRLRNFEKLKTEIGRKFALL